MNDKARGRPSVAHALEVAHLIWPEFTEVDGMVFLACCASQATGRDLRPSEDATGFEAFVNHTHILDFLDHSASRDGSKDNQWWDSTHPDFLTACKIGKLMAQSWFAKLRQDFPQYNFRVYYTQEDNPIVRFHRVRENERPWLDEEDWLEDIQDGRILVLDTQFGKDA